MGLGTGAAEDAPEVDFVGLRLKAGRKIFYRTDDCTSRSMIFSNEWVTGVTPVLFGALDFSQPKRRSRFGVGVQIGRESLPFSIGYFVEPGSATIAKAGVRQARLDAIEIAVVAEEPSCSARGDRGRGAHRRELFNSRSIDTARGKHRAIPFGERKKAPRADSIRECCELGGSVL